MQDWDVGWKLETMFIISVARNKMHGVREIKD